MEKRFNKRIIKNIIGDPDTKKNIENKNENEQEVHGGETMTKENREQQTQNIVQTQNTENKKGFFLYIKKGRKKVWKKIKEYR